MHYIPYFQTSRHRVETMVELAEPKPNEQMVDLGSGDGRIVMAFAQAGIESHGFELDEKLEKASLEAIKDLKLHEKAFIYQKDFWQEDLSAYDIITVYPMPDIMYALKNKLRNEAKAGARILLNYYPFSNWELKKQENNIYLYRKDF